MLNVNGGTQLKHNGCWVSSDCLNCCRSLGPPNPPSYLTLVCVSSCPLYTSFGITHHSISWNSLSQTLESVNNFIFPKSLSSVLFWKHNLLGLYFIPHLLVLSIKENQAFANNIKITLLIQ